MTTRPNGQRIVVGVDGSERSKQALRWALAQAQRIGATVDAVSVWHYPNGYGLGPAPDPELLRKASEQVLVETVEEVAGDWPQVPVRSRVIEGHPAYVLIQEADGAQLLVLGCRGHGGFVGTLLGSVSQYCVQHATCPVVVIRGPHA
jgi:nucleotide-binding universal stress UspA family protein